ncbi:hypothetical protein ABZ490_48100 [Streptomyces sp. NPDC005811]|uniref:hypothetical protein n=1 Tax=Streptomyces sp. NPDC005811 TaxID=3154565 RepID=UPI0033F390D0
MQSTIESSFFSSLASLKIWIPSPSLVGEPPLSPDDPRADDVGWNTSKSGSGRHRAASRR